MAKTNKTNKTNANIVFNVINGIAGVTPMPANAAVLLRETSKRVDGEQIKVTEFLAVTGIRRTTPDAIVLPLLALMVADAQERNGLSQTFKIVAVNGTDYESKLNFASNYTRWLSGNTIYRTDSDGQLRASLTCEEGMILRKTNLCVKKTSPMLTAEGDVLSELLKNAAKAIVRQANLKSNIIERARNAYNAAVGNAQDTQAADETAE